MHDSPRILTEGRTDEITSESGSSPEELAEGIRRAEAQTQPIPKIWADHFWSGVHKGKPDECWPWRGLKSGYGGMKLWGQTYPAHRIAYELTYGAIPMTKFICHKCDNPPCCNPAHLFLGTHKNNSDDMAAKGRGYGQPNYQPKPPKPAREHRVYAMRNLVKRGRIWYFKKTGQGRVVWQSLGTSDVELAKAKRNEREQLALADEWTKIKEKGVRRLSATVGDVLAAYEKGIKGAADRIEDATATANANALRSYVRWVHGKPGTRNETVCVDAQPLEGFTPAQVMKFRQNYLTLEGEDRMALEARRRGAASVLRQARSVFSERAMLLYSTLAMPDLAAWKSASQIEAEARVHVTIENKARVAMHQAITELRATNPQLWLVHTLTKVAGLRNDELCQARAEWFQRAPWGQVFLSVINRSYFSPKGSEGHIPISMEVAKELYDFVKDKQPLDFLVTAPHGTAREDIVNREHANWIRQFLPRGMFAKAGYELRRMAAQAIEKRYVREAAEAFLRHKPKSVAERHYLERFFEWRKFGTDVGLRWEDVNGAATDGNQEHDAWKAGAEALKF